MSVPAHDAPLMPARSWRDLAAPIVSGLCLIHCVGVAVLAPLLPGALAFFAHDPRIEWGLWAASASLGLWMLVRTRALLRGWVFVAWALATMLGLAGGLARVEAALQISLGALAALQILAFWRRARADHGAHTHDAHGRCVHPRT